jgi:hypothetical protein
MRQGLTVDDFFVHADPIQIIHLDAFWPLSFRNKNVVNPFWKDYLENSKQANTIFCLLEKR